MYVGLRAALPSSVSMEHTYNTFSADSTDELKPTGLSWRNPITAARNYWFDHVTTFLRSTSSGADTLVSIVHNKTVACPGTQIVLAGYSQGAMAVHQAEIRLVAGRESAQIIGTLLLADGDRLPTARAAHRGSAASNSSGIRTYVKQTLHLPNSSLTPPLRDVPLVGGTVEICNRGDIICDFGTLWARARAAKSTKPFGDGIHVHTTYGGSPILTSAAASLVTRILDRIRPIVRSQQLSPGTVGTEYNVQLGTYTARPVTWTVVAGALPNGLTLNPTGRISGVPATSGSTTVTVRVTDRQGRSDTATLKLFDFAIIAKRSRN